MKSCRMLISFTNVLSAGNRVQYFGEKSIWSEVWPTAFRWTEKSSSSAQSRGYPQIRENSTSTCPLYTCDDSDDAKLPSRVRRIFLKLDGTE